MMKLPMIEVCPSTLHSGFKTYSPVAQASLFGNRGRKVSHILPFSSPGMNGALNNAYNDKRKYISICGVQEKYSILQQVNNLLLTDRGGTHILKPIPAERFDHIIDLPANEHVSMQIAKQIFGVKTAACGMIFFDDGSPAYITRRFDYMPDSEEKYLLEDFATLLGKSPEREGSSFKYNASYLDIAMVIRKYVAAAPVVLVDYFRLLIVNYLIANGDAHLKNFSLIETIQGDFVLSPAYDLLCTRLHIDDNHLALHGGLYEGDYEEETYYNIGTYTGSSFLVFAAKAGISLPFANQIIQMIVQKTPEAIELIQRSFLSAAAKEIYIRIIRERQRLLSL